MPTSEWSRGSETPKERSKCGNNENGKDDGAQHMTVR